MMFIDPHAHMISRTTDDYEAMARAGVVAVIEPAFWLGQPRTFVGTYVDYLSTIVGFERFRAGQFGIRHYCCIGLNPKEANNEALAEGVMEMLPRFALKEGVVAIGELGYDEQTRLEDKYLRAQLELAKEAQLPVMIHTPHRDKKRGTLRSMDVVEEHGLAALAGGHRPQQRGDGEGRARPRLLGRVLDLPAHQDGQRADDRDPPPVRPRPDHRRFRLRLGRLRLPGRAQDREAHGRTRHPGRPYRARLLPQRAGGLRPERPDEGGRLAQPPADRPAPPLRGQHGAPRRPDPPRRSPKHDLETLTIA